MSDSGTIILERKPDSLRVGAFNIFVDGKKIGKITNGKTHKFEVNSGHHTVEVKAFGLRSLEPVDIQVSQINAVTLQCGISGRTRLSKWLTISFFILNNYVIIIALRKTPDQLQNHYLLTFGLIDIFVMILALVVWFISIRCYLKNVPNGTSTT